MAQCDWNGDGAVDVVDIVQTVDCILNDCWAGEILGCTDPAATNYNPNAIVDDCSCEYGFVCESTVADIDNNTYQTVQIGEQCWMVENLKVTHYQNGDPIPTDYSDSEWASLDDTETGAYAVYYDDPSNAVSYGNLYNWYAVDDARDICPEGWHVPTDLEWTELTDYLGGTTVAGGKMKSTGAIENGDGLWYAPNTGATNESGFTALPAGYRGIDAFYGGMGYYGRYWSSMADGNGSAWGRGLVYTDSGVGRYSFSRRYGNSVRCTGD
ncbi:MAG: fibrobacter succinogenes major paralogous domain-containing protein [Candidatus Marinimicrobia bacterium]|nr:fibrobacter succinogenes major paralogous domain-containing protein [Candidatus Neomarinimicrobiota bacterium]